MHLLVTCFIFKQALGFGRDSRVFLVDNGLGILANPEDENLLDLHDQMGGVLVAPGLQSGLVQTPSALNRWMEEAIILDADSIHDCIAALKPDILAIVEKYRDEELTERRERRRKQQEEEAVRRKKEDEEREKTKEVAAAAATAAAPAPITPYVTSGATSSTQLLPPPPAVTMEITQPEPTVATPTPTSVSGAAEPPSFSSFFHGFNMQSAPSGSTPAVRSRDHAESLATSIVEAVLGPALESINNQQPSRSTAVDYSPSSTVAQSNLTAATDSSAIVSVDTPVVMETPAPVHLNETASLTVGGSTSQSDSTPNTGANSASTPVLSTPFNPIPNDTPGAPPNPRHSVSDGTNPYSTEHNQFLRRPLTFQSDASPSGPTVEVPIESVTVGEEVGQATSMEQGAVASTVTVPDTTEAAAVAVVTSATASAPQPSSEYQSLLGNIEIPEGVDPSFLAALPEDMRQEVIAEQLRLQRLRQRARAQATDPTAQVISLSH